MTLRAVVVGAVFAVLGSPGCSTVEDGAPAPAEAPATPDEAEVWITMDHEVLAIAAAEGTLTTFAAPALYAAPGADVVIARIDEAEIGDLARALHRERHQCGGFIAHTSLADALGYLVPTPRAYAGPITYTIDNPATVAAIDAELDPAQLESGIEGMSSFLNRYYESEEGEESVMWLRDRWLAAAAGRDDVTVRLIPHSWRQPSLEMTIEGATIPTDIVVIGGHLDSIARGGASANAPGADDDASGVTVLGEVARAALAAGYRPDRTIKFYGYAAEEVGLRGSREIADAAAANGDRVIAVMQLDMVAFPGSASVDVALMEDNTNAALNTHIGNLIDTYLPNLTWTTDRCGYGCSDHASWHRAGFPATIPFESTMQDRNRLIHSDRDTFESLNYDVTHAMKFARIAAAFVAETAKGQIGGCSTDSDCDPGQVCEDNMCTDPPPPPDAGVPDAGVPDAGVDIADAGPGDTVDAGSGTDPGADPNPDDPAGGCGCKGGGGSTGAGWLLVLVVVLSIVRRRHFRPVQGN